MTLRIIMAFVVSLCLSMNTAVAQNHGLDKVSIGWLNYDNIPDIFRAYPFLTPNKPKFALLVGINDYKETQIEDLRGPVNSVFAFKELLIDKFQFPNQQNIKILCNGRITIKTKYDKETACTESATAANIEKQFKEVLIENARKNPDATFVFQYVGHGSQAPDVSKDESDLLDETIVTYDSRDKEGKNFDLIDDKLFELIRELAQHTKNALYIVDSCHSGTINRGIATALEVLADTRPQPTPDSSTVDMPGDNQSQDLLPVSDRYVLITGARSNGLAYELEDKPFTALTYYLIQAMKDAKPETSYQDLMNNVIRGVSQNNLNQRPQLVGDKLRSVLNGTAIDQDGYIRILPGGIKGNELKIEAGATTGIQINNIVAVYDKDKLQFVGKDGRKAIGKVIKLDATTATVAFAFEPKITALNERDKVVILSPLFGSPQIKVGLVSLNETVAASVAAGNLQKRLAESPLLRESNLIMLENLTASEVNEFRTGKLPARFATSEDFPSFLVKRGTFGEAFIKGKPFKKITDEKSLTGSSYITDDTLDSTEVFYITDSSGEPIFDFYVKTGDEKADEKIVDTLLKLARQRNVAALDNKQSPLRNSIKTVEGKQSMTQKTALDKVEIQFLKVELGKNEKGEPIIKSEKPVSPGELFIYDFYTIQITNKTARKLHVYLLNISTDGSISVMYPEMNCGEADAISPGTPPIKMQENAYRMTAPFGFERFKVIVSTEPSPSICYLVQGSAKKGVLNPLEILFDEVVTGKTKDGSTGISDLDSWATADFMIEIKPRPQK